MVSSKEWEKIYADSRHDSIWPWSEVVSSVHRYGLNQFKTPMRVLELGSGAGANIPFFEKINANYYGVDFSPTAINRLKIRFPHLANNLVNANFCETIPFDETFDIILDRGSLTHNYTESIQQCLSLLREKSHKDTIFIYFNWFSTESSHFNEGEPTQDPFCRRNFSSGNFVDTGVVHFFSQEHLQSFFSEFKFLELNHFKYQQFVPAQQSTLAYWNFVMKNH